MPIATIPTPPKLPVLGHLHQIPKGKLIQHLLETSRRYPGGIFKISFGSRVGIFVYDADLVAELSDETRFRKIPGPGLRAVRAFAGDGLFTAFTEEPNWGKAHRILMPAFSQRAMRGYFDMILEVADQLVAKWSGLADRDIHVSDDMTRLTLDSIAIAGFGHRFRSFDKEPLDPFLEAMGRALGEAMNKLTRLGIQQRFAKRQARQFERDIAAMSGLVDGIIAERRARPDAGARDLLNLMLTAVDPETGEGLDDINIRYQVLTFLIAGHETTSGLLTFAFHLLLRHPHVLAQAYAEVDRVLPGDTRPDYAHIAKLDVIERVLKETQRLWPTAPGFSVGPYQDEVIGGRFRLCKDRPVNVLVPALHRDPDVWERPDEFDIDRWLPEHDAARHPHAYKPFGSGMRACIGRQFALLEAKLAVAMILQKFAISDPYGYRLAIKETLTIKPDDFVMRARQRQPHERLVAVPVAAAQPATATRGVVGAGERLTVLYGTSLGTARDVAEQIAARAADDGFDTVTMSLDAALDNPPASGVLLVVTATYNGRAPDTAVRTEAAIAASGLGSLRWPQVRFAVLGIGNSQWPNYQAFPKRIDAALDAAGAQRLVPRGEADGDGDFDAGVEAFIAALWEALGGSAGEEPASRLELIEVDAAALRAAALPAQAQLLRVVENRELVRPADGLWDFTVEAPRPATRHVTLELPAGIEYRTGDHVAVYARNRAELVERAVGRLAVDGDALVRVAGAGSRQRHLPLGQTLSIRQLLADFVELQEPASRRAVARLAQSTRCPHTRAALASLAGDDDASRARFQAEIAERRVTLLDLLDRWPAVDLPLADFVELSPAIQPRFYSIASAPCAVPGRVDLLIGTIAAPAWSGIGEHQGFASTYMRDVAVGECVLGYVRRPNPPFAPPGDPQVPMILIGPGTGFAPFRGFVQEREQQRAAGAVVAASLVFYGCRHPDHDWFYREEMEQWRAEGVVELYLAFSTVPTHPWRYVQDALWAESERVWAALQQGAQVYVCGDGRLMAPAVRDTLIRIHMQQSGTTHSHSSAWLEDLIAAGRYHQDVFGFGK